MMKGRLVGSIKMTEEAMKKLARFSVDDVPFHDAFNEPDFEEKKNLCHLYSEELDGTVEDWADLISMVKDVDSVDLAMHEHSSGAEKGAFIIMVKEWDYFNIERMTEQIFKKLTSSRSAYNSFKVMARMTNKRPEDLVSELINIKEVKKKR